MRDFFGNLPIVAGMGFMRGVMLLDDCEGTFTYVISGTGGDDVHEYLAAAAWQGTYGLHLKTRTTNTANADVVTAQKLFDFPATGLLVARLRVTPLVVARCGSILVTLAIDDGAQQYTATLALLVSTGAVSYLNSAAGYTAITALATTFTAGQWYTVELAINAKEAKYQHVRFNGLAADLSTLDLYNPAATAGRCAQLGLSAVATAAGPAEIYADNLVVHEFPEA